MLVALLMALPGLCQAFLTKCCPEDMSLTKTGECKASSHTWLHTEFSVGLPTCSHPMDIVPAPEEGSLASCVDTLLHTGSLAALVCDDPAVDKFPAPRMNYLRKCCPVGVKYSSKEQSCSSERFGVLRSGSHGLLSVLVAGFDGPLDVGTGAPACSDTQVLVDYLVSDSGLVMEGNKSLIVRFTEEENLLVFDTEEVCVDLTETRKVLVVRACRDRRLLCEVQGKTCVRKCCKDGQFINQTRCQRSYRPTKNTELYQLLRNSTHDGALVDKLAFAFGFHCTRGKYPLLPEEEPNDEYRLLVNGSVYLTAYDVLVPMDEYCFADFHSEDFGMNGLYVFFCIPNDEDIPYFSIEEQMSRYVKSAGMFISCTCFLITLIVYCCIPTLQNLNGKNLMCYVASLFSAFAFMIAVHLTPPVVPLVTCSILGFILQFTFLAAFSWLSVICFDIWWTFGSMRSQIGRADRDRRLFIFYSLYAWGQPSIFTAAAILSQFANLLPDFLLPGVGENSCWFSDEKYGIVLFFIGPETLMVTANVVFFVLTARNCSKVRNELNRFKHTASVEKRFQADKNKLCLNAKLFIAMGVSWVLEVASWYFSSRSKVWYAPDLANTLHGVYIFCIFVLKRKVRRALRRRLEELKCWGDPPKEHRPSVSTMLDGVSFEARSPHHLVKSATDVKLVHITRDNKLAVSVADFRFAK